MENERQILEAAVEKINAIAEVNVETGEAEAGSETGHVDAVLWLKHDGNRYKYVAEIKRGVIRSTAHFVARQLAKYETAGTPLLVTDFVTESVGEILRATNTQYMDAAGNAYIHAGGLYLLIEGKKRNVLLGEKTGTDPFGWAGLKVVFVLLCAPDMRNATYRDIARAADVALGTVGGVIKGLEQRGWLMNVGAVVKLREKQEIMKQWVAGYIDKLRPKLLLGRYETKETLDAEMAKKEAALLGGETAAEELNKFLKPGIHTMYIEGDQKDFVIKHRLRKHPYGGLELRRKFWNFDYPEEQRGIVPPLLIYADLIAVRDPRTLEAAEMIYDEYLA